MGRGLILWTFLDTISILLSHAVLLTVVLPQHIQRGEISLFFIAQVSIANTKWKGSFVFLSSCSIVFEGDDVFNILRLE